MRKIYSVLVAVLLTVNLTAQVPQKMSYQGVIHNSNNSLVKNQLVGMKISILQESTTGTAVYVETQTPTTNDNGLVSIEIGGGVIVTGTFSGINWSSGTYFIKTETDPAGGTNYSITGISQLLSVPYALHAKTAESISELDPVFKESVAHKISSIDTTNWNNKLDKEIDGSITNEIQTLSRTGLTVTLSKNGGSFNDSINVYTSGAGISIAGNVISTTGSNFTHYIGELFGGGIIVSVWKEAGIEHGLIASLVNLPSAKWSSKYALINSSLSPIDGKVNTSTIISYGDISGAAYICDNYSYNGFDDWYLPAIWELNQCYNSAFIVNNILGSTNGFQNDYWSSNQLNINFSWSYSFGYGNTAYVNPASIMSVRAVRRF